MQEAVRADRTERLVVQERPCASCLEQLLREPQDAYNAPALEERLGRRSAEVRVVGELRKQVPEELCVGRHVGVSHARRCGPAGAASCQQDL